MISWWHVVEIFIHKCHIGHVKTFIVGSELNGDTPLTHKILAALLTGEYVW